MKAAVATALVLALIGVAAPGCGGDEEGRSTPAPAESEQPLSAAEENGRTLFVEKCGSCHTLDAAGTQGQIGPNLDELPVDEADVLTAIEVGGRGEGVMPKNLVEGEDAKDVAAFVAGSGP